MHGAVATGEVPVGGGPARAGGQVSGAPSASICLDSLPYQGVNFLSSLRTLLFFWLISLVGLLWATFLLAQGVWFWVSVWLVLAIVGSNLLVLLLRFR